MTRDKLVYFNRVEIQELVDGVVVSDLDRRDDDELFRLREKFEKHEVKVKEVKK